MSDRISKSALRSYLDEQIEGWRNQESEMRRCFVKDHHGGLCPNALPIIYITAFQQVRSRFFDDLSDPEPGDQ